MATPPEDPAGYPNTGPLAVLARLALVVCLLAIGYATAAPRSEVPQLLYSNNLEHFAAFYVAALLSAAAFPRERLRRLSVLLGFGALALEASRLLFTPHVEVMELWYADFGGVLAAYVPIVIDRFRRMFPRRGA